MPTKDDGKTEKAKAINEVKQSFGDKWKKANVLHLSFDGGTKESGVIFISREEALTFFSGFLSQSLSDIWDKAVEATIENVIKWKEQSHMSSRKILSALKNK